MRKMVREQRQLRRPQAWQASQANVSFDATRCASMLQKVLSAGEKRDWAGNHVGSRRQKSEWARNLKHL